MDSATRDELASDICRLLLITPGLDKRQLLAKLVGLGWTGLTKTDVNSVLYETKRPFVHDHSTPPRWSVLGDANSPQPATAPDDGLYDLPGYTGPDPRDWQWEAFEQWHRAGRRGVVEAVTGTGKTLVGVMAVAQAIAKNRRAVVLVPGLDLLDQWRRTLVQHLPYATIGLMGGGHCDDLYHKDVLIATVQSGYQNRLLPSGLTGLIVADEVHRYGGDEFRRALQEEFDERLGLTATYAREDNGVEKYLAPYFCPVSRGTSPGSEVVARCDYERGLADGILAPFRVGLVGVSFTEREQEDYDYWDERARTARSTLVKQYGCPGEPPGEFMKAVTRLSAGGNGDSRSTGCARRYLNAFNKRREILAGSNRKMEALVLLAPLLTCARRALVFTETIPSAERASTALRAQGLATSAYTSGLKPAEREEILAEFRHGTVKVLAAPKVLDEGIDVPETDVGVIVAASRSRRQMIQRMGRIIRPKMDGKTATFVVLYVRGTAEDPDQGAHTEFIDQMIDTADDLEVFDESVGAGDLLRWYASN